MSKKNNEIAFEHMNTNVNIKSANSCRECPYKLYATDEECVTLGIGNINSNFIFVLPSYDAKAKLHYETILALFAKAYMEIMGQDLFDVAYVTRLVKCNSNSSHNMYHSAVGPCSHFIKYEVLKLSARNLVFFGSTYDDYANNKNTVRMYIPDRKIHRLYSPAILYYDNPKIKDKLFQDLMGIISNN